MHWMEPCGLWLAAFPVGGPEKAVLYLRIGCWLRKLGFSFLRNLSEIGCVDRDMEQAVSRTGVWLITLGGVLFIFALFISAYWEADIRWLHFFQSWMYIATIGLVWANRKWGLFIGLSAAAFWNYTTLFVNTFFVSGLKQALLLMQSGHLPRPDLFIAVPAWVGNLLVIAGCCVLYVQRL